MIIQENAILAPDFSASDSEGKLVRLSDYRGQEARCAGF